MTRSNSANVASCAGEKTPSIAMLALEWFMVDSGRDGWSVGAPPVLVFSPCVLCAARPKFWPKFFVACVSCCAYILRPYAIIESARTVSGSLAIGVCLTLLYGSHVLSPVFQRISNSVSGPLPWCPNILSTCHSSVSSPRSDTCAKVRPGNRRSSSGTCFLNNDAWNTGWIPRAFRSAGSSISYVVPSTTTFDIVYGPMYLGVSFRDRPLGIDMFFVLMYASCPTLNGAGRRCLFAW
ncbi:hypothetical protein AG1IA_10024 [Rhizoctonia solani AG-1 IA]|uniref:Uncharacterized protein n=1 Tax=Thanatephorus cucumeris (strain AG1-IA) TaxID=983506 RepID=L8WCP6_THACA|nr:hypothetical protein AG1IA_10024 [Rhizoctonia solani AG-1 IA]